MKKTFAVIGLGRFGRSVAAKLYELGNEVLAIDSSADLVQRMDPLVTYSAVADAQDEDALRALDLGNYDCAIVAIGSDLASSVLATLNLKKLGVPQVICKAQDEPQKSALQKVGADRVLIPERETAYKLAQSLTTSSILDFIELSDTCGIAELPVPDGWLGKSLRELNVRVKYGVNIIALREQDAINVSPDASMPLHSGQILVILGENEKLARLKA